MTHRGHRSKEAQQERKLIYTTRTTAIRFIFKNAKNDPLKAEVINTLTYNQVLTEVQNHHGTIILHAIPDLPTGIILIDSKGNGVFQQQTPLKTSITQTEDHLPCQNQCQKD
jgi:hypothetical protein